MILYSSRLRPYLLTLLFVLLLAQPVLAVTMEITQTDPDVASVLGSNEPLYVNVNYASNEPVRFLASAHRNGEKREVGAVLSPATLHASGNSGALAWIAFTNPTHVDELIVTAYDGNWNRLSSTSVKTDIHWSGTLSETPREPADWVLSLQKKERLKQDYMFDPSPSQPEPVSDVILILALVSIPVYIILQIQMLRRYTQRWRELATVPLITALPLVIYSLWVGIGFDFRLWPPFLLYFMLVACVYLLTLWLVKKIRTRSD